MDDFELDEARVEEDGESGSHRTRFLILGVVVALALGYMIYAAFPGNALYFLTVSEFAGKETAQDGRIVRVSGKLVDGSFHREGNSTASRFRLQDEGAGLAGAQLEAAYVGVLPDLFFQSPFGGYSTGQLRARPSVPSGQYPGQVPVQVSIVTSGTGQSVLKCRTGLRPLG